MQSKAIMLIKSFFSFAILAASFCVMASCGSKSSENAGGTDSTEMAPEANSRFDNPEIQAIIQSIKVK